MDVAKLGLQVDSTQVKRASDDLDRFGREGVQAERAAGRVERSSKRMGTAARSAAVGIGRMVGVLGGMISVGAVMRQADAYVSLQNSIQAMGKTSAEAAVAMDEIFRVSQATRAPMEATAKLYTRLSMAAGELGASEREVLTFTETVGKALAASGTSANEASGALLQLSQAMAGGVVRAEEFNSILEGAFPIAQAAADGIEEAAGSVGKLRQLVIEGKISSEEFFAAILDQAPEITRAFDETSVTVSQATTMLGNSFTNLVGKINGETGMTGALAGVVMKLSDFVDSIAEIGNLQNLALGVGAVAAAFAAMVFPVAAAVAALTVGALYIGTHWDDLNRRFPELMSGITSSLGWAADYVQNDWAPRMQEAGTGGLSGIEASIGAIKAALSGDWATAWENAKVAFQGFATFVDNVNPINRLADAFRAGAANVGAAISDLWSGTIQPAINGWAERMVAKGRDLVDGINRGVSAASASVTAAFQSILSTIQSTVASWSGSLVQAGRDLIDGFTRGIREKLSSVGEAVSGAAASAVNTVKSLLKIQSPSRVMHELGAYTMEGYADGVTSMTRDVVGSVTGVMGDTINAADKLASTLSGSLTSAIDGVADAFWKFLESGFTDFKSFATGVLKTFWDMLKQMITAAWKNRIVFNLGIGGTAGASAGASPLNAVGSLASGATGGSKGFLGGLLGSFGSATTAGSGILGGLGSTISAIGTNGLGALFTPAANVAAAGIIGIGATLGAALPIIGAVGAALFGLFKWIGQMRKTFKEVSEAVKLTGHNLDEVAGLGWGAASSLKKLAGGIDELNSLTQSFFDGFYSESEKVAYRQGEVRDVFRDLDRAVPASTEAFKELVEAQDLGTKSGREAYIQLLEVADAFKQVQDAADQLAANVRTIVDAVEMLRPIGGNQRLLENFTEIAAD
jgi:tape measure domain-containing protein